jgi:subtilisin family serine protease
MGNSIRRNALALAVGVALSAASLTAVHADTGFARKLDPTTQLSPDAREVYIIRFVEAGLLNYRGDLASLRATAPAATGSRKLDVKSAEAVAYRGFLDTQRAAHVANIESTLGRELAPTHSYAITLNGVAAELSASEVSRIQSLPGVASIERAGTEYLSTYRGPSFIGADQIWNGSATPGGSPTRGAGITIGVIDGGANSDHPSFANDAACGFDGSNPKLVAFDCSTSAGGECTGPNPEANPGFGHGVHTASTAGGNTIDNTATPAPLLPDGVEMSGVAPCASIRQYKVCPTNSCPGADLLAGIEHAIADQVDVINFSISGGNNPWTDNDRAFLDALNADIVVAASAGNNSAEDPTVVGRVNHLGPWVLTVAASTMDQIIGPQISAVGPGTPAPETQDIPLTPGSTTDATTTFDLEGFPIRTLSTNIEGCTVGGGFPAGYFDGSIALIRRGTCAFSEKITNAFNAGAEMVVIGNNQPGSISMDTTGAPDVPAFSIGSQASGDALIAFVNANVVTPDPDVVFVDSFEDVAPAGAIADFVQIATAGRQADILANFSLRGPTPAPLADLTKPDITGPGVDIFAGEEDSNGQYGFMSGTSMSSPHVAGAAALVRSVHPDWTPAEVRSVLMMTSVIDGTREDGTTPWDHDDIGHGRVDLSRAALAGLTMDETFANFLAANPSGGSIDVKDLNVPSMRNLLCTPDCDWTRTVTNRTANSTEWNVTSVSAPGFDIEVTPSNFTLAAGASQALTITATPNTTLSAVNFGHVVLSDDAGILPDQHLTVAVRGSTGGGGGGLVDSGDVNLAVPLTFDGLYINWLTGATCTENCTAGFMFNAWGASALDFWWGPGGGIEAGSSCVISASSCVALSPGDVIDGSDTFGAGDATNYMVNGAQFLGFRFTNPETAQVNYGFVEITTTNPNGTPATVVRYVYDSSGAAVTVTP